MFRRVDVNRTLAIYLLDVCLTALALYLASFLRTWIPLGAPLAFIGTHLVPPVVYLLTILIWAVVLPLLSVYSSRHTRRLVDELQGVVVAVATASLLLAGALYFSFRDVSRLLVLYFAVLDGLLLCGARLVRWAVARLGGRRRACAEQRVLIVGAGSVGREVAEMVQRHGGEQLTLVGYLDDDVSLQGQRIEGVPVLGRLEQVAEIVRQQEAHQVVVALPLRAHQRLAGLVTALHRLPVRVRVVPDYFNLTFFQARVESFGGMPLISLREPALDGFERAAKRVMDVVLGTIFLLTALPFMSLIALAIRMDTPGPVIFKQQRVGEDGRLFWMYKFRSMVQDAEARADEVIQGFDGGHLIHKRRDDPRVTWVGSFIRRTSLDELPQLVNVLKGDISLVGPRPEMPWIVEQYEDWQYQRLAVPQGITGWWQVNGRSDKPMHLHTEDDLYYIQNYSLLLDLRILWRTVGAVLWRRGAY